MSKCLGVWLDTNPSRSNLDAKKARLRFKINSILTHAKYPICPLAKLYS